MAKKTEVKDELKTVAELRTQLERQLASLESLEKVEDEIKSLAEKYRDYYNDEVTKLVEDGLEEEQAKNWEDELLYKLTDDEEKWKTYTEKELEERGIAITDSRVVKYYKTKYKTVSVPFEELSTWAQSRATAYDKLAKFFENINIMEVFGD